MSDQSKLMGQLAEEITRKVIERLSGSIESKGQVLSEECTNGHTCDSQMHTCTSNEFGCDSYVCENDFSG